MSEPLILLPGDDITAHIDRCWQRRTAPSTAGQTAAKSGAKDGSSSGAAGAAPPPKVMIGPGLKREANNRFVAVKCGQFINRNDTNFWIDCHLKRYAASKG